MEDYSNLHLSSSTQPVTISFSIWRTKSIHRSRTNSDERGSWKIIILRCMYTQYNGIHLIKFYLQQWHMLMQCNFRTYLSYALECHSKTDMFLNISWILSLASLRLHKLLSYYLCRIFKSLNIMRLLQELICRTRGYVTRQDTSLFFPGARLHYFKVNLYFLPNKKLNLFARIFPSLLKMWMKSPNLDEKMHTCIWLKSVFQSKRWMNVEIQCFSKFQVIPILALSQKVRRKGCLGHGVTCLQHIPTGVLSRISPDLIQLILIRELSKIRRSVPFSSFRRSSELASEASSQL